MSEYALKEFRLVNGDVIVSQSDYEMEDIHQEIVLLLAPMVPTLIPTEIVRGGKVYTAYASVFVPYVKFDSPGSVVELYRDKIVTVLPIDKLREDMYHMQVDRELSKVDRLTEQLRQMNNSDPVSEDDIKGLAAKVEKILHPVAEEDTLDPPKEDTRVLH